MKDDPTMCLVLSSLISEMEVLNSAILDEIKGIYSEMVSFIQKIISVQYPPAGSTSSVGFSSSESFGHSGER